MNFVDWLVIIAVVYYFLFKVLVDWATVSGAAAAVANNHQQQQGHLHSNPHQSSSSAGATGAVGSSASAGNHQQNFLLKPRNNRTPGEGTCYEIGESTVFLLHTYKGKGPTDFHLCARGNYQVGRYLRHGVRQTIMYPRVQWVGRIAHVHIFRTLEWAIEWMRRMFIRMWDSRVGEYRGQTTESDESSEKRAQFVFVLDFELTLESLNICC